MEVCYPAHILLEAIDGVVKVVGWTWLFMQYVRPRPSSDLVPAGIDLLVQ